MTFLVELVKATLQRRETINERRSTSRTLFIEAEIKKGPSLSYGTKRDAALQCSCCMLAPTLLRRTMGTCTVPVEPHRQRPFSCRHFFCTALLLWKQFINTEKQLSSKKKKGVLHYNVPRWFAPSCNCAWKSHSHHLLLALAFGLTVLEIIVHRAQLPRAHGEMSGQEQQERVHATERQWWRLEQS